MLSKKTLDILENVHFIKVYDREAQHGEYYREIEFCSDAGEDVIETIWYDGTDKGFREAFAKHAEDFDADEHAETWINHRKSDRGVPQNIKTLIDDAISIKGTLRAIAADLTYGKPKISATEAKDCVQECILRHLDKIFESEDYHIALEKIGGKEKTDKLFEHQMDRVAKLFGYKNGWIG